MSDDSSDKTEEPTGKREEEFREKGNIPRSQELSVLTTLLTSMAMISWTVPKISKLLTLGMNHAFDFSKGNFLAQVYNWFHLFVNPIMLQLILIAVTLMGVSILTNIAQVGFEAHTSKIEPDFSAISPAKGLQKFLSAQIIIQFIKNFLKVFVIGYIVYQQMRGQLGKIEGLAQLPLPVAAEWTLKLISPILIRSCLFLTVIAVGDYTYQWFKIHKQMMMTRQEVKDEMKNQQLPEHVRSKVRQVQKERAKRSIQKEVPKATVIITNPTHFAVAIRYRRGVDTTPRVVAKGADQLAAIIREIATQNNVPIYEYPELARALYRKVKVGKFIPEECFEGVAKVLAFVFQMYRRRELGNKHHGVG